MRPFFAVIAGPTASGKSGLALSLARRFNGQIICCDSVQVYRGFDIGSAKPTATERADVPHHLFDILDWQDAFSAGDYRERALDVITNLNQSGILPIVVGGTGLYLRALFGQKWDRDLPGNQSLRERLASKTNEQLFKLLVRLDPARANSIHANDRYRLLRALELRVLTGASAQDRAMQTVVDVANVPRTFAIILDPPRALLHERIALRTDEMLRNGFIEEVRCLIRAGCPENCKPMQSIGYRQVVEWLNNGGDQSNLRDRILAATRQYAKRQVTWFKKSAADVRMSNVELEGVCQQLQGFIDSNPTS